VGMQKNRRKLKRCTGAASLALAAAVICQAAVPSWTVYAQEDEAVEETAGLQIYAVSGEESDPASALKQQVIEAKAETDETIDLDSIDIENSTVEVEGLDLTTSGIQTVTLKVSLADSATGELPVGYSFTEEAAVKVEKAVNPVLSLTTEEVTLDKGTEFTAADYIDVIGYDAGDYPVWKTEGDVDMSQEGEYTVTYTVVDQKGNTVQKDLKVIVKTSDEELAAAAAEAEAAEQAAAEEAARAEEEARRAEEQAAAEAAAAAVVDETPSYTPTAETVTSSTGSNPYYGGWSNCTYGAWQAAYNYRGVALPDFGSASNWLYAAASYGYATGTTPVVGSIAVYSHHVAYVAAVDGDMVYIIEGGYNGGYNERWVSAWGTGTQSLQGYIYF